MSRISIKERSALGARRWHRRLALVGSAYLLAAGLGALAHQAPRLLGSPPHRMEASRGGEGVPAAKAAAGMRAAGQAAKDAGFRALRLVELKGRSLVQLDPGAGKAPLYFRAEDGRAEPDADRELALALAHAGEARRLDAYEKAYPKEAGPLPAWEIRQSGPWSPCVYVDTKAGQVLRRTDRLRAWTGPVFRQLHMLDFLPRGKVQDTFLLGLSLLMLAIGSGGLWLAWKTRRRGAGV